MLGGMPASTSIKVPKALHDRLAARARLRGTTLARALEQALDVSDEQEFWAAVRRQNSSGARDDLAAVALRDDLADTSDDALGRDGW